MTHAAQSLRLFFALWPDDDARRALAPIAADVAAERGGRATAEANLHVTVAFLGSVGVERVPALGEAGAGAVADVSPFVLTLDRVGGAGSQIAWLAPSSVPPALLRLHESVVERLAKLEVDVDRRRYRPHVTLARRCTRAPRRHAVQPVSFPVDRLALIASTPRAGGSRYEALAAWPL
jgi:2'-5' RNA ligase